MVASSRWVTSDPTPFESGVDLHSPPADWFAAPRMTSPQALTVDEDGRITGLAATWNSCHIGHQGCLTPPKSAAGYQWFHTGSLLASVLDGQVRKSASVPVGHITLDTGHADLNLDHRPAASHYDDTGVRVADVVVGENEFGIWVAGAVRPGVTREAVRTLRASALSGDWRRIGGKLELVALLGVNVPGFPIARSMAASAGFEGLSLVAAGSFEPVAQYDETSDVPFSLVAAGMVTPMEARLQSVEALLARVEPILPTLVDMALDDMVGLILPTDEDVESEMDALIASIGLLDEEQDVEKGIVPTVPGTAKVGAAAVGAYLFGKHRQKKRMMSGITKKSDAAVDDATDELDEDDFTLTDGEMESLMVFISDLLDDEVDVEKGLRKFAVTHPVASTALLGPVATGMAGGYGKKRRKAAQAALGVTKTPKTPTTKSADVAPSALEAARARLSAAEEAAEEDVEKGFPKLKATGVGQARAKKVAFGAAKVGVVGLATAGGVAAANAPWTTSGKRRKATKKSVDPLEAARIRLAAAAQASTD